MTVDVQVTLKQDIVFTAQESPLAICPRVVLLDNEVDHAPAF